MTLNKSNYRVSNVKAIAGPKARLAVREVMLFTSPVQVPHMKVHLIDRQGFEHSIQIKKVNWALMNWITNLSYKTWTSTRFNGVPNDLLIAVEVERDQLRITWRINGDDQPF
jgi:hypothetical protein